MSHFANRKEQIEKGFMRRLIRKLNASGHMLNDEDKEFVKEALKSAAMVGAAEERSRTLGFIRIAGGNEFARALENSIISKGVIEVLGYED